MASSNNKVKTGKFVGAGADKKIVLGFKPKAVDLYNSTDGIEYHKTDTMPNGDAFRRLAAGAGANVASMIELNADGFTVKSGAAIAAKDLHYVAKEANNE